MNDFVHLPRMTSQSKHCKASYERASRCITMANDLSRSQRTGSTRCSLASLIRIGLLHTCMHAVHISLSLSLSLVFGSILTIV